MVLRDLEDQLVILEYLDCLEKMVSEVHPEKEVPLEKTAHKVPQVNLESLGLLVLQARAVLQEKQDHQVPKGFQEKLVVQGSLEKKGRQGLLGRKASQEYPGLLDFLVSQESVDCQVYL